MAPNFSLMADVPFFSDWMRGERKKMKISQEQLARLCGISTVYISKIERERKVIPSDDVIKKIAKNLNYDEKEAFIIAYGNKVKLGKMAYFKERVPAEEMGKEMGESSYYFRRLIMKITELQKNLRNTIGEEKADELIRKMVEGFEAWVNVILLLTENK